MSEPATSLAASLAERRKAEEWRPQTTPIVVGKDILELLSSSMYIDPMTVYREYIQNAVDAIDDAHRDGLLARNAAGQVDINIHLDTRSIRVRDNGTGVEWPSFETRLLAFGASTKRGKNARGFRGVGRLAGLGYCQELIFRSRAQGETRVSELRWDCRSLKSALRSSNPDEGLAELVRDMVSIRRVGIDGYPEHFFEVELKGVVRHRNDRLLSPRAVSDYLSQVAPVPFAPNFPFRSQLKSALQPHIELDNLELQISGIEGRVYRPFGDRLEVGDDVFDSFTDFEIHEIPNVDGGIAAVAWILHHGYIGTIPEKALIKGLRVRSGNIQVGGTSLFEELFPEPRFNGWTVGEINILDKRIVPNGRRDHFEQNIHYDNLLNHIAPIARNIARRCRTSSIARKSVRNFEFQETVVREKLGIISQGGLTTKKRNELVHSIKQSFVVMEKIAEMDMLPFVDGNNSLRKKVHALRAKLERTKKSVQTADPLARLTTQKRKMYEHLFSLIYECSTNRIAAKALVDRILLKIN